MPNIQNFDTSELLDAIAQYVAPAGNDLLAELNYRIIKKGDTDDIVQSGISVTEKGVRPYHAPKI